MIDNPKLRSKHITMIPLIYINLMFMALTGPNPKKLQLYAFDYSCLMLQALCDNQLFTVFLGIEPSPVLFLKINQ